MIELQVQNKIDLKTFFSSDFYDLICLFVYN